MCGVQTICQAREFRVVESNYGWDSSCLDATLRAVYAPGQNPILHKVFWRYFP